MAQIDLKNATIKLKDGDTRTGAMSATASAGASSLSVDGFSAAIANNRLVMVAGDDTEYTITGTTGGATPTAIAISPSLVAEAAEDAVVTILPKQLEINIGEGNLTYTETVNREYKLNRGRLNTVRNGDETPLDLSFELVWEYYESTGSENPTPMDVLKKANNASAWVTTSGDSCEPYCIDVEVLYEPDCADGVSSPNERITFPYFRYETVNGDLSAGTLSVSGKCNAKEPTVVRESA